MVKQAEVFKSCEIMNTVIITEKPRVSLKIAQSIAPTYVKKTEGGVSYYKAKSNGDEVTIASAAGHLYTLAQKRPARGYPVFDIQWVPLHTVDKSKAYVRKYIQLLERLSKDADRFYIATDYDIEGELLGYNALRFACSHEGKKVLRMKFSTLTPGELSSAFQNPIDVDLKLAEAGETRHMMDWFWGINTSRALSQALKNAHRGFVTVSAGRVQTPALAILVKRNKEIEDFVPEPYWEVFADVDVKGQKVRTRHEKGKIFVRDEAKSVLERSKVKEATVAEVTKEETRVYPPTPYDLGTLQVDAYRIFGFVPKKTQDLAQGLYEGGHISYPRTSSQKLPYSIGFNRILQNLGSDPKFKKPVDIVLKKGKLKPRQGSKTDPAHPAIYPTGILPKKIAADADKLYRLIAHRFIAVFGDEMVMATIKVGIDLSRERFEFEGSSVKEAGWTEHYPYYKPKEFVFPDVFEDEKLKVLKVYSPEKKTQPPPKFTPASLIKELENRGLGTKATRADTLDTLYRRGYVHGKSIEVTEFGVSIISTLAEYASSIISEELTRKFEEKLENIREGKEGKESVLNEAKAELEKILGDIKKKEDVIGEKISDAIKQSEKKKTLGKCNLCDGELKIIKARGGKDFIGCSNYPKCKNAFSLFTSRGVEPTDKKCAECGLPVISTSKGKYLFCIDPKCKSNEKRYVVGRCPKCNGDLRIMKVKKQFIGCSNYPDCSVSYPLPQKIGILPTDKNCSECGLPMVSIPFGKRRILSCVDMNCKSKEKYLKRKTV
jgi:DNA topoisomerase-1